jgi:hypothetical protein
VRARDKEECELQLCAQAGLLTTQRGATLSASFQTRCSDFFQTSEILCSGFFQTREMSSHVPACAGPEPCMRFAALSARYLLGITHLSSLNHPCHTGRIASNTNDKLDVSSSPVRARLADANSSSTHLLWHPSSSASALVRSLVLACLIARNASCPSSLTCASICLPTPRASLTPVSSSCCTGLRHLAARPLALHHRASGSSLIEPMRTAPSSPLRVPTRLAASHRSPGRALWSLTSPTVAPQLRAFCRALALKR